MKIRRTFIFPLLALVLLMTAGCTASDDPTAAPETTPEATGTTSPTPETTASESEEPASTPAPTPSTSASPSASPTPAPPLQLSNRPGPHTTGVPENFALEDVERLVVKEDGAVVEGVHAHRAIDIKANDVTVRNSMVTYDGDGFAIRTYDGFGGTIIENVTIKLETTSDGKAPNAGVAGGRDITVRYTEITGVGDGIKATDGSVYEHNWIHLWRPEDSDKHLDAIQGGASDLVIRRNFLDVPASRGGNAAYINTTHDETPPRNILIEENWINGGSYALFVGKTKKGDYMENVRIVRNVFGDTAEWGAITDDGDPAIVVKDNYYE